MDVRELKCRLTEEQLNERRDRLAEQVAELAGLEAKRKDVASDFKLRIEEIEESMSNVAREIRDRSEYREVEVTTHRDYEAKVEQVVRVDTGEIIATRVLEPREMQGELRMMTPENRSEEAEA
jgi:hypothetical protein